MHTLTEIVPKKPGTLKEITGLVKQFFRFPL